MLHFAPEPFFQDIFSMQFGKYETADLHMNGVDHQVDIQSLPFADQSYDFIFASHVLEHIPNDKQALQEIHRILRPRGIAILAVPILEERTIEYPEPNPHESYHVRAPGWDYIDRYKLYFSGIEIHTSESLPEKYQLFIYEDRSTYPTNESPLRRPLQGERHADAVAVCFA